MFRVFIDRPILCSSLFLLIILGGIIGFVKLPIAQYPSITPPLVEVTASYPGATADVVSQSVAAPLEQQLNGTPNMIYMQSNCSNTGSMTIQITFDADADPDIAAVDVQNRVKLAESRLPAEVVENGLKVEKKAAFLLMIITVHSDRKQYDYAYLSNFATINVMDFLRRVPGVGQIRNMASRYYSMRIWLNPQRMAGLGITVNDVRDVIKEQNSEAGVGTVGIRPNEGVSLILPFIATGRLTSVEEFEDIIIRANLDGSMVLLRDIAKVELGSSDYNRTSLFDGSEAAAIGVYLLPNANPVATARNIKRVLAENSGNFPEGIEYSFLYDYGRTVEAWIGAIVKNLIIAFAIAVVVVGVFLKNIRAALIPIIVIGSSFFGSFAILGLVGISINMLSMFGLIFALGFFVDDTVLIIHKTKTLIAEQNLSSHQAAIQSIKETAGTIITVSLMLAAVFILVGFIGGIPGKLFREFSNTLAVCVMISALVTLTLTPSFCALFLKQKTSANTAYEKEKSVHRTKNDRLYEIFSFFLRRPILGIFLLVLIIISSFVLSKIVPASFLPEEDHGYIFTEYILPDGASFERTSELVDRAQQYFINHPAVEHVLSITGISARIGVVESRGHSLIVLKPWSKRASGQTSAEAIINDAQQRMQYPEAVTFLFNPPTIPGLGTGGGFVFMLQDRTGVNWQGLVETTQKLLELGNASPVLQDMSTNMQAQVPQLYFDVDKNKAKMLGVSLPDIYGTMSAFLSSSYVNDFNLRNRVYRVKIQAAKRFRRFPSNFDQFYVKSSAGIMVPIGSLATIKPISGPGAKRRYNMFDAVTVLGRANDGYSSGEAIAEIERIAKEILPPGFGYEWSGITYEEIKAAGQTTPIFIIAILVILILLAARFESWLVPFAVICVIPIAITGAFVGLWIGQLENGLYFQISLVAVVGLALKYASVTAAYAKSQYDTGLKPAEAAINAVRLRLRPLMMSSFGFIPALLPLILARGAGAASRQSIAAGAFSGLITASVLGIFYVPFLFYLIFSIKDKFVSRIKSKEILQERAG